jgi:predicted small lipoprotein YifL
MKKLFTLVLLGTMFSLAACESKKADEGTMSDSASTEMGTTMSDTSMMAPDTTMMMDTTAMDSAR